MAHILPHWNWKGREGQVTPVHVYTNGEAAELFLNGKSLGIRYREEGKYRFVWDDVVYEPGRLLVAAFKDGEVWATDEVETTGEPAALSMTVEKGHGPQPKYGGDWDDSRVWKDDLVDPEDLLIIDLRVTDEQRRIVPTADNLVKVKVKGPAELVYVDAGDPTAHTAFKSKSFRTLAGLGTIAIRMTGTGKASVRVRSKGLKGFKLIINYDGTSMTVTPKLPMFF